MPNYKGHLVGATFCYLIVVALISIPPVSFAKYIQWFASTLAGGLFPDIDTKSKGQQLFYKAMIGILTLCLVYKAYLPATLLSLCSLTPLMTKHRGLFHELWFLFFITGIFSLLMVWFFPAHKDVIVTNALFFTVGFVSHLWLDRGFKRTFFKFR
jgi:hypothetical protein